MFANKYLQKQNKEPLIHEDPHVDTGIIVVIPCFREPEVLQTLHSLNGCNRTKRKVEVIVLINHSEVEDEGIKNFNRDTKVELGKWISETDNAWLKFFVIGPVELKKKWAGAGLARKTGMDEAIRRFNLLQKPDGIIVSLDADTLVEKSYLVEIEKHFERTNDVGATISFEHRKEGLSEKHLEGILLYEKFLHYYKIALGFSGYPYPMFTIGSAFAVTAGAYVKRGGMNRRQAGEDFYFLQNLVQQGNVGEIGSTKVYPSARLSDRVPFGTGPILQKWINGEEDLTLTYNLDAFSDLKQFFESKNKFFKTDEKLYENVISELPVPVQQFLTEDNFWEEVADLNKNCSSLKSFHSRFFQKFNAFKILKYLNFAHEHYYEKADLNQQFELLKRK